MKPRRSPGRFSMFLCLGALSGCATLPSGPAEGALLLDARKIVASSERLDWVVDQLAIEGALPEAMKSVCQVEPAVRARTLTFLERERARLAGPFGGGTAEEIFRRGAARDVGDLSELLTLERTSALLAEADRRADADCPFGWRRIQISAASTVSKAFR